MVPGGLREQFISINHFENHLNVSIFEKLRKISHGENPSICGWSIKTKGLCKNPFAKANNNFAWQILLSWLFTRFFWWYWRQLVILQQPCSLLALEQFLVFIVVNYSSLKLYRHPKWLGSFQQEKIISICVWVHKRASCLSVSQQTQWKIIFLFKH